MFASTLTGLAGVIGSVNKVIDLMNGKTVAAGNAAQMAGNKMLVAWAKALGPIGLIIAALAALIGLVTWIAHENSTETELKRD
ncbi:MAG: hypothetical protein MJ199_00290 [Bacilli bacterium]|nr:hypothetical protein [Bacilli bacterium]